jgi:uncharacterized protein
MENTKLYINPKVIKIEIENNQFFYLKNPFISNGEQVINTFQNNVFNNITNGISYLDLHSKLEVTDENLKKTLAVLQKKEFISLNTASFTKPLPREKSRTLSLWIHTSNKCNLACSYCYVSAEKEGKIMTEGVLDEVLSKVLDTVKKNDVKKLRLKFAGGEPLLTFHMWSKKIDYLKQNLEKTGAKLQIQIITNGTIISDSIIKFLVENEVGVGLSLDGFGTYQDQTRFFHNGKGSFEKVYKNLQTIRENGIDPYVTTVVSKQNIEGLEQITSFFVDENLRFRFSIEKYDFPDIVSLISKLKSSYQIIENRIDEYNQFLSHKLCDLSFDKPIFDTPCGVGVSHASVNFNGNIHTCQTEHFKSEIGNIFNDSDFLQTIQNQERVLELPKISESCQECSYKYTCAGGCPVTKVHNKSPFCYLFHEIIPIIFRIRGKSILNTFQNKYSYAK